MSSDLRPKGTTGPLSGGERTGTTGRLRPPTTSGIHRTDDPARARAPPADAPRPPAPPAQEPLKLSAAEFNTAMVHFYRGEVQRSNTWRNRLDTTTNWA